MAASGRSPKEHFFPFSLTTALRASREVGSFGVLIHPIDEEVRQFHKRWGFQHVPVGEASRIAAETQRALKRYEEALRIGATMLGERGQEGRG